MDRRLRKTEEAIQNALIELVSRDGYENLKMVDVIEKADINKSTFYLHYQSLLGVSFAIEDKLIANIIDVLHSHSADSNDTIASLLDCIKNNRKAWQTVLNVSEGHFYKKLEISVDPYLSKIVGSKNEKEILKYKKAALFGGLFGIMRSYAFGSNRTDQQKVLAAILNLMDLSNK